MPPTFLDSTPAITPALIGDESGLIYAIQEERLTGRRRSFWGFPRLSIKACLDRVGIRPEDLLVTTYGGNQVLCRYHSREDVLHAYRRQATMVGRLQRQALPADRRPETELRTRSAANFARRGGLPRYRRRALRPWPRPTPPPPTSGCATSPAEKYLVLTCDGEPAMNSLGSGLGCRQLRRNRITPEGESLGARSRAGCSPESAAA